MVEDEEGDWVGLTPPVLLTLWLCDWEPVVVPVPAPDDPDAHWVPLIVPELVPEACDEAVPLVEKEGVPVTLTLTVKDPLLVLNTDTVPDTL